MENIDVTPCPGHRLRSLEQRAHVFAVGCLLTALCVPFEIVSPRKWQSDMFVGINRNDTKAASALVAQRLRPDVDWRASPRCRKPHDGLTDAFCIAEYGRRRMAGERAA